MASMDNRDGETRMRDEQLHVGGVRSLDDVAASTSHYCTAEKGISTNLPDKTRVSL